MRETKQKEVENLFCFSSFVAQVVVAFFFSFFFAHSYRQFRLIDETMESALKSIFKNIPTM